MHFNLLIYSKPYFSLEVWLSKSIAEAVGLTEQGVRLLLMHEECNV